MKKRLVAVILTAAMTISGCNTVVPSTEQSATPESEQSDLSESDTTDITSEEPKADTSESTSLGGDSDSEYDISGGYPWIDSDLRDNMLISEGLTYKDDFNVAVNREWSVNTNMPEGYSAYGTTYEIRDIVQKKAIDALSDDSVTEHDSRLATDMYKAFLDWDSRNELGLSPLKEVYDDIDSISDIEELSEFFCDYERCKNVPELITPVNSVDLKDSDKYGTFLDKPKLLLEDSAEYKDLTSQGELIKETKYELFKKMMEKMGYDEETASKMFENALSFETQISRNWPTNAEIHSPEHMKEIMNYFTFDELTEVIANYPVKEVLKAYGYDNAEKYIIESVEVLKDIGSLYTTDNLPTIKDYLKVNTAFNMCIELDQETFYTYREQYNKRYGSTGRNSDEVYAYRYVNSYIPEPLEKLYMQKYDSEAVKDNITGLCQEIIEEYRVMLTEEDWLTEKTKNAAIDKLDSIKINVVEPDKWHDYSSLDFTGMNYLEITNALNKYYLDQDVSHTNQAIEQGYWSDSALNPNAYYEATDNSINILLGILDGNYYRSDMTKEQIYGGIGSIIGHEISHAFDTRGAQFDKDGNLSEWWSKEDYEAFKNRAEKLIDYYDGITAFEGYSISGELVQTEAIADMAGLKVMLALAKKEKDFDYQEFFKCYAGNWREIISYEYEAYRATQDDHPLNYLRTNVTVQQYDEFYEAFDVKEGDGMYLAPEERVAVW